MTFISSDPVGTAGLFSELSQLEQSLIAHRNVYFNFNLNDVDKHKVPSAPTRNLIDSSKSSGDGIRKVQSTRHNDDRGVCSENEERMTKEKEQKSKEGEGRERVTDGGYESMQIDDGDSDVESDNDQEGGRGEGEGEEEIDDVGVPKMSAAPREFQGFVPLGPDLYASLADPCLQVRVRVKVRV